MRDATRRTATHRDAPRRAGRWGGIALGVRRDAPRRKRASATRECRGGGVARVGERFLPIVGNAPTPKVWSGPRAQCRMISALVAATSSDVTVGMLRLPDDVPEASTAPPPLATRC